MTTQLIRMPANYLANWLKPGPAPTKYRHIEMLVIAAVIVVGALSLRVRSDQRVYLAGFANWPLPQTCPARVLWHINCPGCGLTRSLIFFAHGDFRDSYSEHRLGWLFALSILAQFPYRLLALWRWDRVAIEVRLLHAYSSFLAAALIVNWVVGLFAGTN